MLAATYKLNNLNLVPIGDWSRSPILASDDPAVQLHRDAVGSEIELSQHFLNIRDYGQSPVFTIDYKRQKISHKTIIMAGLQSNQEASSRRLQARKALTAREALH